MLKPISFPIPLPDDPHKWDGWSQYNSPDSYERLCLDPRTNPSNELIEEHLPRIASVVAKKTAAEKSAEQSAGPIVAFRAR